MVMRRSDDCSLKYHWKKAMTTKTQLRMEFNHAIANTQASLFIATETVGLQWKSMTSIVELPSHDESINDYKR
jgi:hypothetical protein